MVSINIEQFKALKKSSSDSYHQQKNMIKKIMLGQPVKCKTCNQSIKLTPANDEHLTLLTCPKGCTDIQLEIS